jgi:3'-phosphoadenosine 5'-phosphosulfate sulfotransferase (PAPS reductase)/FAD synthetase
MARIWDCDSMLQDVTEAAGSTPKESISGNPYRLPEGNVCVSFSGGRSSSYMLKQILLANPEAVEDPRFAVVFCNTGREIPETLDFVQECQTRFGIRIHWIEWVPPEEGYYRIVNHNSASRDGEPFKRMIEAHIKRRDGSIGRRPLPNPVSRICTTNLKLRLKLHYVRRELGWKTFTNAIGFRGDEMHRVARAPASAQPGETIWAPMAEAGTTKEDVIRFWRDQDFDLMLRDEKLGNCDLCLSGETEVVTDQGIKMIRDLAGTEPNLLVPVVLKNGLSEVGYFKSAPVRSFGIQRLYKVNLTSHGGSRKTVFATADHRWFISKTSENSHPEDAVPTIGLKPGTRLRNLYRQTAGDNRGGISTLGALRGFVFGDGTVRHGSRPGTVNIHPGKDEVFTPYFEALFGRGKQASDSKAVKFYGIPYYWKQYPSLDESREYLLGWLSGWFTADGCVSKIGNCQLTSASLENIEFGRSVCAILGIRHSPITQQTRMARLPNGSTMEHTLYKLNMNRNSLPHEFFWIQHHKERVVASGSKTNYRANWTVQSVTETDRVEEVFCAVVEGVGAFGLADGLMTGNCFMKSAAKISSIINENPSLAGWWVDVEERALASDRPSPFRQDRPTYKQMRDAALTGQGYNFGLFDDLTSCGSHGCTD